MKEDLVFYFWIFIFVFTKSFCFNCGPKANCFCESNLEMDCSERNIPIRDICDFINNETDNRVNILHLEHNSYGNITRFDLKGCNNLSRLYLGGNEIRFIETGSLISLFGLKLLDISNNQLAIYDRTSRQTITFPLTLESLLLNGNPVIKTSDASYPNLSSLSHLSVLYMDGVQGSIFPDSYRKCTKLATLVLSGLNGNCNISQVTNSTFINLPHIRTLNISSCNIENITAGAFQSLPNLEVLDLSENLRLGFRMLSNVSYGLQFTNIKSLNFSKIYNTFGIGTQLRKRDICYLWNTTLNEFVLNKNRLVLIETNALLMLPDTVKVVRLEDNKFTFGPYLLQLGCNAYIEEIYASYQNTAHNPLLFQTEPVEKYDGTVFSRTDCPFMQDDFLRNLSKKNENCYFFETEKINILANLPKIPKKLRKVEFSRCDMEYTLNNLTVKPVLNEVEYLDFSGNILYSWIGPIGKFPKLKHLNLSRNYCSHVGLNFFDWVTNVTDLQLQENFLGLVLSNERYGSLIFEKLVHVKVLNLSSNIISYLPPLVFSRMTELEILDLSVNNIDTWTIYARPLNNLLHLNLKLNFFHILPTELTSKLEGNAKRRGIKFTLDLSNNTLTTYCDEMEFLEWMVKHRSSMVNFTGYVFHDKTGSKLSPERFVAVVNSLDKACRSYTLLIVLCSIGLSVFLAVVIGGFIYKKRWQLRYLMRTSKVRHFGYRRLQNNSAENVNYIHDAFISYAGENITFILDKILPKLESQGMKLCLHDKDFLPGNNIADNILEAIRNSRKTVVILSKEFLKSKWCIYEFNMARMESIYSREGENCLLVVMYEDVPSRDMSTEMLDWIRTNTYIEYTKEAEGEELFWQNVGEALSI